MEIPSITDKMQLHKGAITPTLDNGSPPSPPVEIESDLSGPGVTRPTERGDEVKINQDNRFPAETEAAEKPPIPEIHNPPENVVDMQENNENIERKTRRRKIM